MSDTKIEPGDLVIIQLDLNDQVNIQGEIVYMPQGPMDSIILMNAYGLHYIQQYCCMTRKARQKEAT